LLGVVALGVAGIFAGLLANTKSAFFYTALVVHVDLSVLVWFLTMACMFFTLVTNGRGWQMLANSAFLSFAAGAVLIVVSATSGGEAYMSNYIPVIHHPVFFLGLSLLLCGVLGAVANMCFSFSREYLNNPHYFGIISAGIIMLIAILCFIVSARNMPAGMSGQLYYEYAFWGGGHVLQFVHTQLMIVAWLWLAHASGIKIKLSDTQLKILYAIGLVAALAAPLIYFGQGDDMLHSNRFTLLMKHANGLAALIIGVALIYALLRQPWPTEKRLFLITLSMSVLLFAAGGTLGYLIAGSNVTVPAHYHGSIVGITLAFMGMGYLLLPSFGYVDVARSILAKLQPVIYGGGQLCWMTGMAMLGAHGVPRKTPGSADTMGVLASFLKHSGDGLALIGGLLFVFIMLRAVSKKSETI